MEDRFMKFVIKNNESGCWLWSGGKSRGYGHFSVGPKGSPGKSAHRVSYELFKGRIPDNLIIRHKCRNKCVNPDHLELGTYKDNADDRIRDGVTYKGIKNPACKYTEEQIKDIRRRYAEGESQTSISKSLGIRQGHISDICLRKVWKHI